ncbi:MAG: ABC transporter permease [Candidatus Aminicenantes bacterium]|nr:MAG: ABC transporter permease [Candidatus Aminicenantes bacterium]
MIKNYLLTAFRNIKKHKGYSLINIAGLAIGMAVCLLIWYYVSFERSYDSFQKDADNIYRLKMIMQKGERTFEFAPTCLALGPALKAEFPEVLEFARIHVQRETIVAREDTRFYEELIFYVDPSFLKMFYLPLKRGNPRTALTKPNTLLISESAAKKYFGNENPVGKNIHIFDRYGQNYTVEGIFKDLPENSHMQFDFLASNQNVLIHPLFRDNNSWMVYQFYTYILTHPDFNLKSLETKIAKIIDKYMGDDMRKFNRRHICVLQPLRDIHLYSDCIIELKENGNATALNWLLISAVFILIIAWVNYININTARAMERAREVGLRKVVGASRIQLIRQFFAESLTLNILSAGMAIILVLILIPYCSSFTGSRIFMTIFSSPHFWVPFLVIFVIGTFFTGLYPAFILSSFKPGNILREKFINYGGGRMSRQVLVVFQFTISVALIAATLTVYQQIRFMKNQDLGFNKDQVLVVRTPRANLRDTTREKLDTVKTEILKDPRVLNIAGTFHVPGHAMGADMEIRRVEDEPEKLFLTEVTWVRYHFLDTLGIKLFVGRDFSEKIITDREAVIINEKAMNLLGFESPEKAIDAYITTIFGERLKIIGVIKNYNHRSLKEAVKSRIIRFALFELPGFFAFKLNTNNIKETVEFIEKKWKEVFPNLPFDYFFLDEFFNQQYKADNQFGAIFGFLALLTIFIAASGLFGLSAFNAARKTREIGIRKVLGADVVNILVLLSKNFLKLVFTALLIALPLTYLWVDKWLTTYAYRTTISWWFWVIPILITIPIVLLTLSYNVIKAAYTNPANTIRYE